MIIKNNKYKKYKYYINKIILLTKRIYNLNKHLKKNKKDYKTERILIKIVYKKKNILKYIKKKYINLYYLIIKKLNIKIKK
ncbi:MAG: hypothetical protein RDO_1050 [Flavobacteriales endosymbiont of Rhyzopertha dominica]|nr:MAG: 30S ribosomal protein S15 [Candidatus Shikimatogenerans bostrichidophilus]